MSAIVEELALEINKKIDEKFEQLNEKALSEPKKSRVEEVLMESVAVETKEGKQVRDKKLADMFVNEYLRTGRISDKAFDYYNTATATEGGNLVPEDLYDKIIKKANQISAIRMLATIRPTTVNDVEFIVEKSGVVESAWSTETGAKGETKVEGFDKITIACHDLYAKPKATNRMLSDNAFDLEGYIVDKIAEAFISKSGEAYVKGDGVGKPSGLLTGLTATALATASKVTFKELNTMVYALKQKYANNAVWVMNRKTLGEINGLTDLQGNPIFRQPELRIEGDKVDGYLLNYPVYVDDSMPSLLTAVAGEIPLVFGDIKSAYAIVDNVNVFTKRDDITETGFTKFPTVIRTGGKRLLDEAVVALKQI